ncbi:hypothetical protein [Streptomyces sp. NPDC127114]|uniref:hypothetical protein n=1 Tax=Streptomyces sp. NPDC127114 TaxID=3345366 RepID=UPI00363631A2
MASGTLRATAVLAALVGLVLGLLVCGAAAGAPSGAPAGASAGAPAGRAVQAGHEVRAGDAPVAATAPAPTAPAGPGCGQGHGEEEGAATPAVPPRPHGFGELLPALAGERTPCGGWGADQDLADAVPGPEPPELVPPSPVELSVLRV